MPNTGVAAAEVPLISLMRGEFKDGKWWWLYSMAFRTLGAAFAVLVAVVRVDVVAVLALPIAVILAAAAYYCQYRADRAQALGEETRRAVALEDGLGWHVSPQLDIDLRRRFSARARGSAARTKSPPDPYYASTAPVGPARLLANLQESAWWQAALSERMGAYVGWALLTLGLVLLVTIIVAFTTVGDQTARQLFGTLVANVVLVLMATRTADLWWRFHTHAGKVRAVGAKADMVASGGRPLETTDVLHLVHDYDIALSGAPQVPDKVYWWHRDELNALWDRRLSTRSATP